jgi:hypothetical protein
MQARTKLVALSLSIALLSGGVVSAQEKKPETNEMGMTQEQMEAMMKLASPGEMHKQLGKMAGDWTFTNKMWMAPGQPPMESTGTMHAEAILGGRYIQSHWKGEFMGQPFEGQATEGYDNISKQYVSSWVDNVGTGIMHSVGTCEDGGKKCTVVGESSDPMSGGKVTMKSVLTWMDDNSFKNEMYGKDPASGQEMKMMEITVKRKK